MEDARKRMATNARTTLWTLIREWKKPEALDADKDYLFESKEWSEAVLIFNGHLSKRKREDERK